MSLTSMKYILFLFAAAIGWWLLPGKSRNYYLLLADYVFYVMWQPLYALLLAGATLLSYVCALLCARKALGHDALWTRTGSLFLFLTLFSYKYLHFLLNDLLGLSLQLSWTLPLGISFYTFSAAGYLADVRKGKLQAERSFVDYALFLSLFPSILSGPINRARDLLPQLRQRSSFQWNQLRIGLLRYTFGAAKKLVAADLLGTLVDGVYGDIYNSAPTLVLCAVFAYSLQIYFDFSGYSDMALGSAQILGLEMAENFDAPYFGGTMQEFWRRWHMSLTGWFREYLYFPLGGSRKGMLRTLLNILIVFTISGLWHGAACSFLLWGLLNGIYLVCARLWTPVGQRLRCRLRIRENNPFAALIRGIWVFLLISAAWVLFRTGSVTDSVFILKRSLLFCRVGLGNGTLTDYLYLRQIVVVILLLLLFTAEDILRILRKPMLPELGSAAAAWPVMAVLWLVIALFGVYGTGYDAAGFVYFQF